MSISVYLKFEPEVAGSSGVTGFEKQIEVQAWNNSFHQPTNPIRSTASGGTVESATHHPLSFTKYLDAATPALIKNCWSGTTYGKATLTCIRTSGSTDLKTAVAYLVVTMENVIIASYSVSGGSGDLPVEHITLSYAKVAYTHKDRKKADGAAEGDVMVSHDLKSGVVA